MSKQYLPVSEAYLIRTKRQLELEIILATAQRDSYLIGRNLAREERDEYERLAESLLADPKVADHYDAASRLHDAWKEIAEYEAELARVNNNLDALLEERDGLVRERDRLQDSNRALHLEVRDLMEKLDEVAP